MCIAGSAGADPPIDNVHADLADGVRQVIDHLLRLGHRHVAYIGADLSSQEQKLCAYRTVMADAAISTPAEYVQESDRGFESGCLAAARLLSLPTPPTAVFAGAADLVALGVIRAAAEFGLSVPEALSVVGFNDVPVAAAVTPALTTVAEPHLAAGEQAARLLLERLATADQAPGRDLLLPCRLVVRGTTAALHNARSSSIDVPVK